MLDAYRETLLNCLKDAHQEYLKTLDAAFLVADNPELKPA